MLETSQNENDEPDLITIAELTRQSKSIVVAFRALEVKKPRHVRARRSGQLHRVAEAVVGDSTAIITLILWDSDIDEIEVGNTYILKNGYVSVFEESMQLNRGRYGNLLPSRINIDNVNHTIDMSRPFMSEKSKTKRKTTSGRGRSFHGAPKREKKGYCSWRGF